MRPTTCNPPVIKGDAADDISQPDQCARPQGGDMTIQVPEYTLTVTNLTQTEE